MLFDIVSSVVRPNVLFHGDFLLRTLIDMAIIRKVTNLMRLFIVTKVFVL